MQRILTDHKDITLTTLDEVPAQALGAGQARLRIDRFALTANNVTYAAAGFVIGYWNFFPTGIEGKGIVPVWGFGDVVESTTDALAVGTRIYGLLPMASELILQPEVSDNGLITDVMPHRAALPPVYNRYVSVGARSAGNEGKQALLQPLLATSFLISDWLQDNSFFEAEQVIVGSASSKTGLGLCKFLAEMSPRPVKIIGLTSDGNVGFVDALGACDSVVPYDALETIAQSPSVYVDMSGNGDVRSRVHTHLGDNLRHSSAVGTSHWDKFQPKQRLAGPAPVFFFAPAQIEKRRDDWGPGVIERKISEAWRRIATHADSWLDLRPHDGLAAAQDVYGDLAAGTASPRDGHVVTLKT